MGVRGGEGGESVTAISIAKAELCLHLDTHLKLWIIAFHVQNSRK